MELGGCVDGLLTAVIADAQCLPLPGQVSAQLTAILRDGRAHVLGTDYLGLELNISMFFSCSPGIRLGAP